MMSLMMQHNDVIKNGVMKVFPHKNVPKIKFYKKQRCIYSRHTYTHLRDIYI